MDRDELRRGQKTLHYQYAESTDDHVGLSMAMAAGDMLFFMAYELIGSIDTNADIRKQLLTLVSREYQNVCVAQMQDVYWSTGKTIPKEGDVLSMYRYKTARYTFSVPLVAGAVLSGMSAERIHQLDQFGEQLGILYQIRDDFLGSHGNTAKTGKPVGHDARENKQTLASLTDVDKIITKYENSVSDILEKMDIPEDKKTSLVSLKDFVLSRNS
jgi:geranylgeranyl diphosphate synthase type I